jgi:hypothetical protein
MMLQFPSNENKLLERKRNVRYRTFFKFHITFFLFHITFMLYPIMFFIFLSYYDFYEYSLMFILNRMSKRLKSVTKKLFGGKSSAERANTLFQDCSTASTHRAEMLKHVDPSLVGRPTCSQRDEVIYLFSYHFLI